MRELSLHILDLAQNSVKAQASLIEIGVCVDVPGDLISFAISDDGKGMSKAFLAQVTDPFVTTRTTRKVGMGISLTKAACESCGGIFSIESEEGRGTRLTATFAYSHIDRQPLGDMAETMASLILANPEIDWVYRFTFNRELFEFDTREIKETLGGAPINDVDVIAFIKDYIAENMNQLSGGIQL